MLTPEFLDAATGNLESLMYELENHALIDVARRISKALNKGGLIPETAQYQLTRLSELRGFDAYYKSEIARITKLSFEEIDRLIIESAKQAHAYDLSRFLEKNLPAVPELGSERLHQMTDALREHTKGEFTNITRTAGFAGLPAREYFTRTLDKAFMQVSSGLFDYNTVIRRTVNEMTETGLQTVRYGRRNLNVVTAVRNAVLTSARQVADRVSIENIIALNLPLIEVSAHANARNKGEGFENHQKWQGRRFSVSSYEDLRNALNY